MSNAILNGTKLSEAKLAKASLLGVDLSKTNLDEADLIDTGDRS